MHRSDLLTVVLVVALLAGAVIPVSTLGAARQDAGGEQPAIVDERSVVSTDTIETAVAASVHDTGAKLSSVSQTGLAVQDNQFERQLIDAVQKPGPGGLLLAGYSRYDSSDPLENAVRQRVFQAIERSPGTYPVEIAGETQISRSTIRYHTRILEEEGLITGEKIRGKQRYFPGDSDDVELLAALSDDASQAVLSAIERLEPVTVSHLAADLDRAPSTISHHLDHLTDADLVEQEREYVAVLNRLSSQTRQELHRHLDTDGVSGLPAKP